MAASLVSTEKNEPRPSLLDTKALPSHDHVVVVALDHDHQEDDHGAIAAMKKLQLACLCSFVFMCVQLAGGYYTDSLAILSDAAHVLSDVASFLVSLFAMYLGQLPASATMPFGYHRAEVIGALLSVLLVWVLAIGLLWTAMKRVYDQGRGGDDDQAMSDVVDGKTMFVVAVCGLGINLLLMKILGHGHCHDHSHGHSHGHSHEDETTSAGTTSSAQDLVRTPMSAMALIDRVEVEHLAAEAEKVASPSSVFENINVRAAYVHALGDFVQSLGVCLAGALIWYNPSWQIADPITTILFSCLVLATTLGVLTRSVHILMEGAPPLWICGFLRNAFERSRRSTTCTTSMCGCSRKAITRPACTSSRTASLVLRFERFSACWRRWACGSRPCKSKTRRIGTGTKTCTATGCRTRTLRARPRARCPCHGREPRRRRWSLLSIAT